MAVCIVYLGLLPSSPVLAWVCLGWRFGVVGFALVALRRSCAAFVDSAELWQGRSCWGVILNDKSPFGLVSAAASGSACCSTACLLHAWFARLRRGLLAGLSRWGALGDTMRIEAHASLGDC